MSSLKLNSSGGGSVTLTPASTASNLTATVPAVADTLAVQGQLGLRNKIINGAMMIDQRNAGASVTSSQGYTLDRWTVNSGGGALFNVQRDTTAPDSFINSLKATVGTADSSLAAGDYAQLFQVVEGFNFADMAWGTANAKSVTLSFWVRASVTGTYAGGLVNSAENRSYVFTYSVSSANTWEYKTITVAGDTSGTWVTDNGKGVNIRWDLGSGSNFQSTAGSWVASHAFSTSSSIKLSATAGATFYITGVQLEKGATATPFENRLYGTELALCQRYYALVTNLNGFGQAGGTTIVNGSIALPVVMRTSPTIGLTAAAIVSDTVADYTQSSASIGIVIGTRVTTSAVNVQLGNFTGLTALRPIYLISTSASITASAEL